MKKTLTALLLSVALASAASACPMCKDSVSNKEGDGKSGLHDSYTTGGQNISGGINTSVYVMLGTLFGVLGMVSTVIVKGVRGSSDARDK
jgi:hypothetical protein